MNVLDLTTLDWTPVTWDDGRGAAAASVAFGDGEAHVRVLRLDPDGEIGPHETGLGQLFVPVHGSGWVRLGDDEAQVRVGEAVYFPSGVVHAKGSHTGMMALVIQVKDLECGGEVQRVGPP